MKPKRKIEWTSAITAWFFRIYFFNCHTLPFLAPFMRIYYIAGLYIPTFERGHIVLNYKKILSNENLFRRNLISICLPINQSNHLGLSTSLKISSTLVNRCISMRIKYWETYWIDTSQLKLEQRHCWVWNVQWNIILMMEATLVPTLTHIHQMWKR